MTIRIESSADSRFLLESDRIAVEVDAAAGGKIRSLRSKVTGVNYLYTDPRGRPEHLTDYCSHDMSGFDECFPTVNTYRYPDGTSAGDHGLLWQRPWEAQRHAGQLVMRRDVPTLGAVFERTCSLEDDRTLLLQYCIKNQRRQPLEYLYAAHMLLVGRPDARLELPAEVDRIWTSYVVNLEDVTVGDWLDWPLGDRPELCPPLDTRRRSCLKAFTPRLARGRAAMSFPGQEERLEIEFDVARLPYLGILIHQGADGPFSREILLALEPTTGMGDDPAMCRANQAIANVPACGSVEFWIRLRIA